MNAVLDTCILVDYLRGLELARQEIDRYDRPVISVITWMEVLVGARDEAESATLRDFLEGFELHDLDRDVAEESVRLRRSHRVALPDAIVWATARSRQALLVTRDATDFPSDDPFVRVPYRL